MIADYGCHKYFLLTSKHRSSGFE